MDPKLTVRLALLGLVLLAGVHAARDLGPGARARAGELHYRVQVRPDRSFEVELEVQGWRGRAPRLRLLDGWGLLQNQSSHIEGITFLNADGEPVPLTATVTDGDALWTVPDRPGNAFRVRYRVTPYDPFVSPEASFADRRRAVLVGYSMFLFPDNLGNTPRTPIRVEVTVPDGWPVWSSWPETAGEFRPPTPHDLWSGVVAAGAYRPSRIGAGHVSVTALTENRDHLSLAVSNRLLPVLREMAALFGAPPRGDSLNVLALYRTMPVRNNMSQMIGNSEEGSFLCLATPDRFRDADQLTVLASHECLHFYLGGAVTATSEPPFRNTPDLIWFTEGVTEFLTFRLMEQAGVLSPRALDEVVVEKEREYRGSPGVSAFTLADAARRMEEPGVYGLVYSKGFLAARLLEEEMTRSCGAGTFEGVLRRLFEEHNYYRDSRTVTPAQVREAFEDACPGAGSIIDRYATGRETIPPSGVTVREVRSPRPAVR